MDCLSQYNIPFNGLDNDKDYFYSFIVEDSFFNNFEKSEIKGGNIDVSVKLNKKSTSLNLEIHVKGYAMIICDRCLDEYKQNIDFKDHIFVTFGEETNFDTDNDFVILEKNLTDINISQFIYEFAHFALPFVHYHPEDSKGNSTCNPGMLKYLDDHSLQYEDSEEIDIRWNKLIEIKNNNFNKN